MREQDDIAIKHPLKILLVEDSPLLRSRLTSMLAQYPELAVTGYAAAEAEAVNKLSTVAHDALVVDVELRPGNGISVIRHARAIANETADQPRLPIVVLTNYDLPIVRERCFLAGADYFFDKMREIDQLVPLLLQIARTFQKSRSPR